MFFGLDSGSVIIIGYFLFGAFFFKHYGFLDRKITVRTIIVFALTYPLLHSVVFNAQVSAYINDSELEVDPTDWRVKVLNKLFGDSWS